MFDEVSQIAVDEGRRSVGHKHRVRFAESVALVYLRIEAAVQPKTIGRRQRLVVSLPTVQRLLRDQRCYRVVGTAVVPVGSRT